MIQNISVVVVTSNEEKNIKSCLKNLSWASEIVVVDSGSTDRTTTIASIYTKAIFSVEFNYDYSTLRNLALKFAKNNWIFMVDTDEKLSENAKKIIANLINKKSFDGYWFPRRAYVGKDKYLKHGYFYPDYQLRLFRNNGKIKYSGKIHEQPIIPKEKTKIIDDIEIYHNTSHCKYDAWIHFFRFRNYIPIEGRELVESNIGFPKLIYLIPLDFIRHIYRSFIKLQGYKDGYPGFRAAVIFSMYKTCVNIYALVYKLKQNIL